MSRVKPDTFKQLTQKAHAHRSVRLFSPNIIPYPPMSYVLRAWWTSSTGTKAASGCPPESRRPPPAGGMRPSWPGFLASPGRRPFLPGPLSTPLSYILQLCNGPNRPKRLQSNKPKKGVMSAILQSISGRKILHDRCVLITKSPNQHTFAEILTPSGLSWQISVKGKKKMNRQDASDSSPPVVHLFRLRRLLTLPPPSPKTF